MQTEIDYKYGDIILTLLVDYDADGTSLEEIYHKGEDISEIVDSFDWGYLKGIVAGMHTKLLEADKMTRAEEAWERREDK